MTNEQKIQTLNKAIDSIIDVAEDVPESNFHFLVASDRSVVNQLRTVISKIEDSSIQKKELETIKSKEND